MQAHGAGHAQCFALGRHGADPVVHAFRMQRRALVAQQHHARGAEIPGDVRRRELSGQPRHAEPRGSRPLAAKGRERPPDVARELGHVAVVAARGADVRVEQIAGMVHTGDGGA